MCGQNLRPVPEPSTTRETPRPHQQSPTPPLSQPGQTHPLPVWERSRSPAARPRGSASPAERRAFRVRLRRGASASPRSSRPSDAPHVGGPAACVHRPRTDTRVASALRRLLRVTPPWTLLDTYLSEPVFGPPGRGPGSTVAGHLGTPCLALWRWSHCSPRRPPCCSSESPPSSGDKHGPGTGEGGGVVSRLWSQLPRPPLRPPAGGVRPHGGRTPDSEGPFVQGQQWKPRKQGSPPRGGGAGWGRMSLPGLLEQVTTNQGLNRTH